MPLRLRHDYAAGFHRDLPAGDICRLGSSLHLRADTRHGPAHIRQVGAGGLLLRGFQMLVSHVHLSVLLAGPESSDSADSSRRCQGCLPSFFPSRKSDCPQLLHAAATALRWSPFTSTRFKSASWRSMSPHQAISACDLTKSRFTKSVTLSASSARTVVITRRLGE
jgi:hypothetical protein